MKKMMNEMAKNGIIEYAEMGKRTFIFVKDAEKAKPLTSKLYDYFVKSVLGGNIYNYNGKIIELYFE